MSVNLNIKFLFIFLDISIINNIILRISLLLIGIFSSFKQFLTVFKSKLTMILSYIDFLLVHNIHLDCLLTSLDSIDWRCCDSHKMLLTFLVLNAHLLSELLFHFAFLYLIPLAATVLVVIDTVLEVFRLKLTIVRFINQIYANINHFCFILTMLIFSSSIKLIVPLKEHLGILNL